MEKKETKPKQQERNPMCVNPKSAAFYLMIFVGLACLVHSLYNMFDYNSRYDRITKYNHYVTEWNEKYYEPFLNTIFSYKMDNQTGTFLVVATGKESFEFVKDKCDRPSDPAEGCVNATSVFHLATVKLTGTSTITLSAHGKEVLSYELPYASTKTLSVFDLDCHYESGGCPSACQQRGGQWSSNQCVVPTYLDTVSLRLRSINDTLILDSEKYEPFQETYGPGTRYSNKEMVAYKYEEHVNYTTVVLLNAYDPAVMGSLFTYGCATDHRRTSCFGPDFGQNVVLHLPYFFIVVLYFSLILLGYLYILYQRKLKAKKMQENQQPLV